MTGRSFWLVSLLLLSAACHLAFVLFGPNFNSQNLYQNLIAVTGTNKLQTLSAEQANRLSSSSDNKLVHAVCAYDLSRGPIQLTARFPESYWSVNIYSLQGDVIYTLNDRQANADSLSIVISSSGDSPPIAESETAQPAGLGEINVLSDDVKGLAVLRSALINEKERKRVAEALSRSQCQVKGS